MRGNEGREREREREIMIIASKFFCVGSHLYTLRMRCHFRHDRFPFFLAQTTNRRLEMFYFVSLNFDVNLTGIKKQGIAIKPVELHSNIFACGRIVLVIAIVSRI